MNYEYCSFCKCILAGLEMNVTIKLCEISNKYPYPDIDHLIQVIRVPVGPTTINFESIIDEYRLKLSIKRLVLELADEFRITQFVQWLNEKLIKIEARFKPSK